MKKSTSKKILSTLVCVGMLLSMCMGALAAEVTGVEVKTTSDGAVTVEGTISGNAQVESTILVTDGTAVEEIEDSNIVYIDQVTTNPSGDFSYSFKVDSEEEGQQFKLYLGGTNVAEVASTEFELTDDVTPEKFFIEGTVSLVAKTEAATEGLTVVAVNGEEIIEGVVSFDEELGATYKIEVEEAGTYNLVFARQGYLRAFRSVDVVDADVTVEDVALVAGDIRGEGTNVGDGEIGSADLVAMLDLYALTAEDEGFEPNFDIDSNGEIEGNDLIHVLTNYGEVEEVQE